MVNYRDFKTFLNNHIKIMLILLIMLLFIFGVVAGYNAGYHNGLSKSLFIQIQSVKTEPEIDNFLYNGIYGWFCDDTSSYEPAISDLTQSYIDRKCHLISIDNSSVNRSYYLENGWD